MSSIDTGAAMGGPDRSPDPRSARLAKLYAQQLDLERRRHELAEEERRIVADLTALAQMPEGAQVRQYLDTPDTQEHGKMLQVAGVTGAFVTLGEDDQDGARVYLKVTGAGYPAGVKRTATTRAFGLSRIVPEVWIRVPESTA